MNTETKNRPVRKAAAIIGFAALLVLIAWLSIVIVKNVPGSFASLASLAESVRSFDASRIEDASDDEAMTDSTNVNDMLIVTSDTNVIETDGDVRLSWTDASTQGSFVFSYACAEGVAVSIIETDGVRDINCDTNYNLGNVNNITLNIASEKERFVDIDYSLSFLTTDDTEPSATTDSVITVVNDSVALSFAPEETPPIEEEVIEPIDIVESEIPVVAEVPVETTPTETPMTGTGEGFTQEFTFTIPVSDPDGRTDLSTRFIDTGRISNNTFVAGTIDNDETGAIQFEVKNLGTKTSEEWTYSVTLPSGGKVDSADQDPLKPNERAVITIGFPASSVTSHDFYVTIETESDNTSLNNQFIQTATFSN